MFVPCNRGLAVHEKICQAGAQIDHTLCKLSTIAVWAEVRDQRKPARYVRVRFKRLRLAAQEGEGLAGVDAVMG